MMKHVLAVFLLLTLPATTLAGATHPYIKPERPMAIPELGVPAPIHPGPAPLLDYLPEYPVDDPPKPNAVVRAWKKIPYRDRDLMPGYLALGVGLTADLYSTREAIRLSDGRVVEGNIVLVGAEEVAERLRLPRSAGRDAASIGLTAGYALVVRNMVYPRSRRLAKLALYGYAGFRIGLFFWNRRNLNVVRVPR
jgi:hypothetical protein